VSAAPSLDSSGQVVAAPPALGADAAQVLFEQHAGAIYGFCLNRLGSREEAEDAVQTTFLNAFRALRRGVVPQYESAWLYKIAENVCRERHRSAGRRLEVVQDPAAIEETAPAAATNGRDELLGLDDALARLAPRQRRALLLREWKGLSYREIAQELELTPAAVETLLFRARRSLARNLQVGALIPWFKSLLGGSAAVKAAAAASVVVASGSLGGGAPVEPQVRAAPVEQRPAQVARPSGTDGASTRAAPVVQAVPAAGPVERARRDRVRQRAASRPRGTSPAKAQTPTSQPGAPLPAHEEGAPTAPPELVSPPAPASTSPPAAPPPAATPPPPPAVAPPAPPPAAPPPSLLPELPQLPGLPALPPPPPLPPAPLLPPLPQLPGLPALPPPPQLPGLPLLPPPPPPQLP
jgi:RNA polymerase sigma factor (sigma-70 family)